MSTVTPSLSARIADGIVELIDAGQLQPGDAIESSRSLAARFEVTTPTVREALRRLEAIDVIRFRHGSGTYVGPGVHRRVLANPHPTPSDVDAARNLLKARLVLEPPIAAQAAQNRDDDQLSVLTRATNHALVPQRGGDRPSMPFHVALAAATGNPILRETVEALLHVRADVHLAIRHDITDRERDHREHAAILAAVRDRNPDAAAQRVREHLEGLLAHLD